MKRFLVTGIGRSGTTLIYQQLARLLLLDGLKVNFRYEPYLWDIRTHAIQGNPFGMEQLSNFGLYVHTETPLFLDAPTDLHDRFLDSLFAAPWDGDPARSPDACLTKVIRGSGRLRTYLARFPDLKIIACLRNPYDTINSSLGMFSFFGEEFHKSDRSRFKAAMIARGMAAEALPDGRNSVEWYAAWWQAFTAETLAVAAAYPDNVFAFCYEAFDADPGAMLQRLQDFVGVQNEGMLIGLKQPAGPRIKATSLTHHDIAKLRSGYEYYQTEVLAPVLGEVSARAIGPKLLSRYVEGKYSIPLAGSDLGRKSPIQLRGMMIHGRKSPHLALLTAPRSQLGLGKLIERHAPGLAPVIKTPVANPEAVRAGKRFGLVITSHNNGDTIIDAILSGLNQTLPFDEIVVVDDKSTDGSLALIKVLAEQYSSITVVALDSCLGPSAARHIGITRLSTEFCTQLDGDDLFWPSKNAAEAAALAGDENAVTFSDILLVTEKASLVQSTAAYASDDPEQIFARLMARAKQIPRDLTFARARYFEAGGYDMLAKLYEDWDFKLRLAALPGLRWRRAPGIAGTVYNRLTPGLSGQEPAVHARFLLLIFLKALRHQPIAPATALQSLAAATEPFKTHDIVIDARKWLGKLVAAGQFDPAQLARFAGSRRVHGLTDDGFRDLMRALAASGRLPSGTRQVAADSSLAWQPYSGFVRWQPQLDTDRAGQALALFTDDLLAPSGRSGFVEIDLAAPLAGLTLAAHFPLSARSILVEVAGVRQKTLLDPVGLATRQSVYVALPLAKGKSLLRLEVDPAPGLDPTQPHWLLAALSGAGSPAEGPAAAQRQVSP